MFNNISNTDPKTSDPYSDLIVNTFGTHVYKNAMFGNSSHTTLYFKNVSQNVDIPDSLSEYKLSPNPPRLVESYVTTKIGRNPAYKRVNSEHDPRDRTKVYDSETMKSFKIPLIDGKLESIETFFDQNDEFSVRRRKLKSAIVCSEKLEYVKVSDYIMTKVLFKTYLKRLTATKLMSTVKSTILHRTCPLDEGMMNGISYLLKFDPLFESKTKVICVDGNIMYEHSVPLFPHMCTSINPKNSQFKSISCMCNIGLQNFPLGNSCVSVYSGYDCNESDFLFNINEENSVVKGFSGAGSFRIC